MSSVKRKRSSKKKRRKKKRRTPIAVLFEEGDYVQWSDPGGNQYNEGRVIRDTGVVLQVLQGGGVVLNLGAELRLRVTNTKWRDLVEVGSCLELSCGSGWLPCKVRGVQGARGSVRTPPVVVVEPLFYGGTISVPLNSLRLRRPPCLNRETRAIVQSGFGFSEACACPSEWAPYDPRGSVNDRGTKTKLAVARFTESPQSFCFVLSPPCSLPSDVCFVRCVEGDLKFARKSELTIVREVPGVRHCAVDLGSLNFPLAKTASPHKDVSGLVIPWMNAYEIAQNYFDFGDASSAATILQDHSDDYSNQELARALLVMSGNSVVGKPVAIHPVGRFVWQHSVMHRADYAVGELSTLSESLALLMSSDYDNADFRILRDRVSIWSMYVTQWGMARRLQIERESHYPVSATLESLGKDHVRFSATVVPPLLPSNMTSVGVLLWGAPPTLMTHMGTILDAFTPDPLCVLGEGERLFDKSNWLSEVGRVGTVQPGDTVARRLFNKERGALNPMNELLMRMAVSSDGDAVRWNACQGPIGCEEARGAEAHAFAPCWAGGIVTVPCNEKRLVVVSQLLRMGLDASSHSPATLIITSPTLLHFWKHGLESRGIPCYAYHGAQRHRNASRALLDKKVFITTTNIFVKWADLSFFVNAGPFRRVKRLIMDTNTVLTSPQSRVLDGISRLGCKYLWMLESNPEKDHLAIALALLNIRPFSKHSGWGIDLVSDFRRREYVHNLLYADEAPSAVAKNLVHFLVKQVCTCARADAQITRTLHEDSIWIRHSRGGGSIQRHKRELELLSAFKTKLWKSFDMHYYYYTTERRRIRKSWQYLTQICWGMKVPARVYGEPVARGSFHVDPLFFSALVKKWETGNGNAVEKSAAVSVKKLMNYERIDGSCPVCMDPLTDNTSSGGLSSSVAVGTCGHMFCGECADQIFRVAEENRTSNTNDFGTGYNSVNHPRCPLCRKFWDKKGDEPPLLLPTEKGLVLGGGCLESSAVYAVSSESADTYGESVARVLGAQMYATPLLSVLEDTLQHIHEASTHPRVVIFCETPGLAKYLEERRNLETTRAVSIHSHRTVDSRGNAIKSFGSLCNNIREIYISASLVAGLVFGGVRHFVFADRMGRKHLESIVQFMGSCCRETLVSNPGFLPVVHTLASVCNSAHCCDFAGDGTVLLSDSTVGAALRDFVPLLPEYAQDYIQKFHDLFAEPLPQCLKDRWAFGGSEIVPIQLEDSRNPPEGSVAGDFASFLSQADTDAILEAGLPLPDFESSTAVTGTLRA